MTQFSPPQIFMSIPQMLGNLLFAVGFVPEISVDVRNRSSAVRFQSIRWCTSSSIGWILQFRLKRQKYPPRISLANVQFHHLLALVLESMLSGEKTISRFRVGTGNHSMIPTMAFHRKIASPTRKICLFKAVVAAEDLATSG